jgi:dipeptidyl aminopeptidase/acylaminoacyl peptidase
MLGHSRAGLAPASLALAAIVAAIVTAPNEARAQRTINVDDVLAFRSISDVAISPDGQSVAYVVAWRDREANLNRSAIWIASSNGERSFRLTHGPRADRAPAWSRDGSWLAFLSERDDKRTAQVFGIDPRGGDAWQVSKSEKSISAFELSPDGRRIAWRANPPDTKADRELEKLRGRPIVRDSAYTSEWSRLYVASLTDRIADSARLSSPEELDVTSMAWAPDSRRIAWSAKPSPLLRRNSLAEVYIQDEVDVKPRQVTSMPGGESVVAWTRELGLLVAASGQALGTFNRHLWVVSDSGGEPVNLTAQLDEDANYIGATSSALFVEAARRTGRGLFRIPLTNGRPTGNPDPLTDESRFYSGFSSSTDASKIAFVVEASTTPPDVYVSDVAQFSPRKLSDVNPRAKDFAYGDQRVVQWKSKADGETIEGVLTLPVGYAPGARVPLLLVIHGGPSGVSSNRFPSMRGAYPTAVFNAAGYAILQPNYRGSTGYGQRFRALNRGDISGRDWIDVNSGVDAMIANGIADPAKLGIMGWSFGGHHTFWGITQTNRFKAASAGAGANDLISMYSQTDMPEFYHTYLGPRPWENFDLYEQRSAYRFVKNVATPLLIQVGEADRRVPAEQSIQFYEAVKGLGKVPTKLVLYPGQPHGINDARLQRDLMMRNVEWFAHWIPVKGPTPPIAISER